MSPEGTGSGVPIALANERLLRSCFDRVPGDGATLEYDFDEADVEEWSSGAYSSVSEEPNSPWRHFFTESENGKWRFDTDALVEGWCNTLRHEHGISTVDTEKIDDGLQYKVKVDGKKQGIIEFILHFESEQFLKDDVNPRESQFLITFDIPQTGIDRESVFPWNAVSNDDFWDNISEILIELQGPPAEELYTTNSYVAKHMPGGPKRTLESICRDDQNLEFKGEPKYVTNIKKAGDELDVPSLISAAEIDENTHLAICGCNDVNTDEIHLHLIEDGEVKNISNNERVSKTSGKIKEKTNNYNDLKDDQQNTGKFLKLTLGLLTVGALPAINTLIGVITDGEFQLEPVALIVLNTIFLAFVLGFFLITIQPMFELWHFNWDQSEVYNSVRSRIVSMLRNIFK